MNFSDLSKEELLIFQAIIDARKVQNFLWKECSLEYLGSFKENSETWIRIFQKRVNKIKNIDLENPSASIELRKRVLQQAALSILALKVLEKNDSTRNARKGD